MVRDVFEMLAKNIQKLFFSKNPALSRLYPYGDLTSCKKIEKTNEQSLEIFKDGQKNGPTDGQGQLLRIP